MNYVICVLKALRVYFQGNKWGTICYFLGIVTEEIAYI